MTVPKGQDNRHASLSSWVCWT